MVDNGRLADAVPAKKVREPPGKLNWLILDSSPESERSSLRTTLSDP